MGQQQIADLDAAVGPPGDGRRRAVLHVVGVRDDMEHAVKRLLRQGGNVMPDIIPVFGAGG